MPEDPQAVFDFALGGAGPIQQFTGYDWQPARFATPAVDAPNPPDID